MKKLLLVVLVLVFSLGGYTSALAKERIAGDGMLTVSHLSARIRVNSFGSADQFQMDQMNHLFEALQFVSVNNGPVQLVNSPAYAVVTPVTVIDQRSDRTATYSAVQRVPQNDLFIEFYNTIVDNTDSTMDWYIEVYLYNITERDMTVCYFPYLDLDLFGTAANDMATAFDMDPDAGVRSIRLSKQGMPNTVFVITDFLRRSDGFEMRLQPELRNRLSGAQNCIELANQLSQVTGDFTGALRYNVRIPGGGFANATVTVSLTLPFN